MHICIYTNIGPCATWEMRKGTPQGAQVNNVSADIFADGSAPDASAADTLADISADIPTDISIYIPADASGHISAHISIDISADTSADISADTSTDISADTSASTSADISIEISADITVGLFCTGVYFFEIGLTVLIDKWPFV